MSIEVIEQPVEQVEEPAVAAVVEPEIEYIYQATDDAGRPLGGKQVFKGKTHQEILEKVAEANKNLIRLNRELNRKIRLGDIDVEEMPDDAARLDGASLVLEPKVLSAEEKAQLSRDLLDPDKFDEASDRLFTAKLGANPTTIAERLATQEQRITQILAKNEGEAFVAANPEYYACVDNFQVITNWMVKNGLAPVRSNFQLAYDRLKAAGLLLEAPIVREEIPAPAPTAAVPESTQVKSTPVQEEPSRITTETPALQNRPAVRTPSGLSRSTSSDVGLPVQRQKLTLAEIEKMPSADYKRRLLTDPSFAKAVDELYAGKK